MIAADHDRGPQVAAAHHFVEAQTQPPAFAVAEPADARGKALEGDSLACHLDPTMQVFVVGELLQHGTIGGRDVGGVAAERDPTERSLALAEQRTDVRGQEARVVEGALEAAELGLGAQAVAVVEHLAALVHEADHRAAVHCHALATATDELLRVGTRHLGGRFRRQIHRDVAERIVGAGLVGDDVGREVHVEQLLHHLGGVAHKAHRQRTSLVAGSYATRDGIVQRVGDLVEVAVLVTALYTPRVHVDAQRHAVVHRDGERLRAAHATQSGSERDRAGERAGELAATYLGEALVGALQNALGADVDP